MIRLTLRRLLKNLGFTATVAVTLGLGIGATAAIFSLVNAVLLRPLPFPQPERLMWLQQADRGAAEPLSYPDFFDWRAQSRSFDGMACWRGTSLALTGRGPAQQLQGATVSANFFRVLGVQPSIGRDFLPDEEKPGARIAMLSHALWQSAFGSRRDIAGSSITLDGQPYTVAGVMPAGFAFPVWNPGPALWITLARDAEGPGRPLAVQRGADMLDVAGRLKKGVSEDGARVELDAIARQIAASYPDTNKPYTAAIVKPMLEHLAGDYRPALRVLFAAVLCLLLIACANVAGLLLMNASRRTPEIAVRAALGASRGEITREVLLESVLLALCGGALGIGFSSWMLAAMVRYLPRNIPRLDEIAVDATVLAFVTGVSVLTGILFGLAPAWRAARLDPAAALRDMGRGAVSAHRTSRLHNAIVIAETAIGLVLLVGAGLLIRSFVHVMQVNPGFDPGHVLTASLSVPPQTYPTPRRLEFYDRLMERVRALPGVQSVAAGYPLPLAEGNIGISFAIEGRPVNTGDEPSEQLALLTPGFFATMRIPVLEGREFTARDDKRGKPVILINRQFARKYFGGENPLGKRIRSDISDGDGKPPMREVIGVVGDVKRRKLVAEADPMYYLPWAQAVVVSPALCVRTAGDPAQVAGALRAELAQLDASIPLFRVRTMESLMSNAASEPRFHMLLVTSFALAALALAAVGLYAVLSYMVVQRRMEIGLRMALGAQRADVLGWVLRRGMTMAGVGAAIGLAAAAVLTRQMEGLLFGVQAMDGATLAAVSVVLLAVSGMACCAPAWRAARLDPMETLREQ